MTPQAIFASLSACGISLCITPDGHGIAIPAGLVSPAQRAAIVANKPALIAFLRTSPAIDQLPKPAPVPARPPSARPAPAPKPMGWMHLEQPWRAADAAYQTHHWQCTTCKSAATGHAARCTDGQRLHLDYTRLEKTT